MTRVRIENVVASTSLGDAFDLPAIVGALPNAEYEPAQFPGLIFRMQEPRTAILLFHSGKLVCTGGKSWHQVEESIRIISGLLRKGGHKVFEHPKIQVQNIVATADLGGEINLNMIAVSLGLDRVEYEPEQFPGVVYRMQDPRVVILLFGSGKMVCTGARRPSDLSRAVENITKELRDAGLLGHERAPTESPRVPVFRALVRSPAIAGAPFRAPGVPEEDPLKATTLSSPPSDRPSPGIVASRPGSPTSGPVGHAHVRPAPRVSIEPGVASATPRVGVHT